MKFFSIQLLSLVAFLATSTFNSLVSAQVYSKCTNNGFVALTFDEGPSPNLPQLLEFLREGKAYATFHFVARYLTDMKMRQYVKQVKEAGHEIGLRTDPNWNLAGLDKNAIQKLIIGSAKVFETTSGAKVTFVRVPYDMNDAGVIGAIENAGYIVTKPDLDSQDYGGAPIDDIVNTFDLAFTASPEGSSSFITVQRDAVANSVSAVPQIIASGVENGYEFVTLSTCVGIDKARQGAAFGGDVPIRRGNGKDTNRRLGVPASNGKKRKAAFKKNHESSATPLSTVSLGMALGVCFFSMFLMQ
jgi:peptidoglycan/xylan/chitin deacetylase (PgdA/CDA1 family)